MIILFLYSFCWATTLSKAFLSQVGSTANDLISSAQATNILSSLNIDFFQLSIFISQASFIDTLSQLSREI